MGGPGLTRVMLPKTDTLARIVVCEDDQVTLDLLCENLSADRYDPIPAPTAEDAIRSCGYGEPDLMLLDISLPDASGLEVLRTIRADDGAMARFDSTLPVIVLSGHCAETDRVRGFAAGADDYLTKPFSYAELAARIGAVLRRRRIDTRTGPRTIGPLRVEPAARAAYVDERAIELTNKEYQLLLALSSDPTRVFTKQELLEDVWGYSAGARTRTIDSHASRLRRKLDPERGRFVVTCWGVGYRLVEA